MMDIKYILIAFTVISLEVSFIIISTSTYISVFERTNIPMNRKIKEITGVLDIWKLPVVGDRIIVILSIVPISIYRFRRLYMYEKS